MGITSGNDPIPSEITKKGVPIEKTQGEEGFVKQIVDKFEALSKPQTPALAETTNDSIEITKMTSAEIRSSKLEKAGVDPHDIQKGSIGEIVKHSAKLPSELLITTSTIPTAHLLSKEEFIAKHFNGCSESHIEDLFFSLNNISQEEWVDVFELAKIKAFDDLKFRHPELEAVPDKEWNDAKEWDEILAIAKKNVSSNIASGASEQLYFEFINLSKTPLSEREREKQLHKLKADNLIVNKAFAKEQQILAAAFHIGVKDDASRDAESLTSTEYDEDLYEGFSLEILANLKIGFVGSLLHELISQNPSLADRANDDSTLSDLIRIGCQRQINFKFQDIMKEIHEGSQNSASAYSAKAVQYIKEHVSALDNLDSIDAVTLADGNTRCFSLSIGSKDHAIDFEFRKENGEYYIIMHNRGAQSNDSNINSIFHGLGTTLEKEGESGVLREYAKTSVKIKANKSALENEAFLNQLVMATRAEGASRAYQAICDFLINNPDSKLRGEIIETEGEIAINKLIHYQKQAESVGDTKTCNEIRQMIAKLIPTEKNYHSMQLYGTCVESNSTTIEESLASPATRMILKTHTLNLLVDTIATQVLSATPPSSEIPLEGNVAERVQKKIDKIKHDAVTMQNLVKRKITRMQGKLARLDSPEAATYKQRPPELMEKANDLIKKLESEKGFKLPVLKLPEPRQKRRGPR